MITPFNLHKMIKRLKLILLQTSPKYAFNLYSLYKYLGKQYIHLLLMHLIQLGIQ